MSFFNVPFFSLFLDKNNRSILFSLTKRSLYGHYKNSVLGWGWHFATPLLFLIIYYTVFTGFRESPFPNFMIYLVSGLFPFNFLVSNITRSSGYIIGNSGIVKKMNIPRELLVMSEVLCSFIVLSVGLLLVLAYVIVAGYPLTYSILALFPLLLLTFLFALGYSLIISSVVVYFRDLQHILNSISMIFFFITPMYYLTSETTGILNVITWINPLTYFIESYHHLIFWGTLPDWQISLACLIISIVVFVSGTTIFRLLKRKFAEKL